LNVRLFSRFMDAEYEAGSTTPGFNRYSIGEVRIENLNLRMHFDICWGMYASTKKARNSALGSAHSSHVEITFLTLVVT
jgi:hypothetical protein